MRLLCARFFKWMNQNYAKRGKFFSDSEGVREAAEAVRVMQIWGGSSRSMSLAPRRSRGTTSFG